MWVSLMSRTLHDDPKSMSLMASQREQQDEEGQEEQGEQEEQESLTKQKFSGFMSR
jgi:hypothetical protein